MDNNGGRDGRNEHHANERPIKRQTRETLPKEFEGMNFEQQRGNYKNSDGFENSVFDEKETDGQERRNDY